MTNFQAIWLWSSSLILIGTLRESSLTLKSPTSHHLWLITSLLLSPLSLLLSVLFSSDDFDEEKEGE